MLKELGFTNPFVYTVNDTELDARMKISGYRIHLKETFVGHIHPDSALSTFKKQVSRGRLNIMLIKAYSEHKEHFFSGCSHTGNMRYLLGMSLGLISLSDRFIFDLVTGIGWRIGYTHGYFFRKKLF